MNSQTKTNKRILALDILRGVTIAGMIMVNNPALGDIYMPPCATLSGMASPPPISSSPSSCSSWVSLPISP